MFGLDKLHHTTLAQVALAATLFLVALAVVVWKMRLLEPSVNDSGSSAGTSAANQELEVRLAVAKSYAKSCLGYITALEETTQAMLDLKSSCWKLEEKREMTESHELLRERTRASVSMFRGNARKAS